MGRTLTEAGGQVRSLSRSLVEGAISHVPPSGYYRVDDRRLQYQRTVSRPALAAESIGRVTDQQLRLVSDLLRAHAASRALVRADGLSGIDPRLQEMVERFMHQQKGDITSVAPAPSSLVPLRITGTSAGMWDL